MSRPSSSAPTAAHAHTPSPPLSTTSATTPNQLSLPRAMLRKLAKRATKNPIEVIVTIFVIVTLAYFQVLHAVTTSNFFEPLHREAAGLAAASSSPLSSDADAINDAARWTERGNFFVRKAGSMDWIAGEEANEAGLEHGAAESEKLKRFLIEPVIVVDSEEQTDIKKALRDTTLANVAKLLQKELGGDGPTHLVQDVPEEVAAYTFARLSTVEQDNEDATFEARRQLIEKAADVDMLATTVNASVTKASALRLLPIFSDDDVGAYGSTGQYSSASTEELRSVRWMAYAMRALVMRFWALVKRADSADIFVMLSAYILMHGTFVNLFLSMRKFGSNFWLGASVLTSSIFAFLCALAMAYLVGVTVDPICLSEALPFLVITVGFEKPFLLTRAVFTHPAIAPQATTSKANPDLLLSALNESQQQQQQQQQQQRQQGPRPDGIKGNGARVADDHSQEEAFVRALTARLRTEPSLRWSAPQPVPANEVVEAAVDLVGVPIIRDYAIEIAVMAVGATSGVSGLREFCQLAALILIFDCAFLFCFFISILTVMVEVHRIKVMRGMRRLKPSTPPNVDSDVPFSELDTPMSTLSSREDSPERAAADGSRQHSSASARPLWRRIVKLILGKVPFERSRHGRENPVARLKLLLITAFLTLHSLNLVSTLTTQSAFSRHQSTGAVSLYKSLVDTAPGVLSTAKPNGAVMDALLRALTMPKDADVIVRVADPIIYVLVDSAPNAAWSRSAIGSAALNASGLGGSNSNAIESPSGSNSSDSFLPTAIKSGTSPGSSSSLAVLDSFMSLWTVIVGDPVISKWMSLALAISIFLNAYLLKGIATGNAAVAEGNAAGAAAFAAARMIGAHLNREGSRLSTADAATDGKPSRRWSEKPAERPNMHDSISEYHLKLAQLSASHAKGKLDQVPRQEEGLSKADVPTKAVAADGVAPDAAASVRDEAKTGEKPSDSLRVKVAGFVGNDGTQEVRPLDDLLELYAGGAGVFLLSDEEVILLAQKGKIQSYALEKLLQDHERAVRIRRALISRASTTKTLESSLVPHSNYDYAQVMGACCENVVGYMPLPVGIAGPLTVDGQVLPIPMATTEGTLVASTSRGCKALNAAGGVTTVLTQDAMTRGPVIEFSSITQAAKAKRWIDSPEGASTIKESFDSTSRFARLSHLRCVMAGRTLYVRFATATGDAMGMNMVSKGVEKALELMSQRFEMQVLSLSGNYCIDKKPSAINWIEGRGKSVCCEAVIPGATVKSVLKTTVKDLVNLNIKKNLIGSAMAGSVGGFNAHAANIVAAVFLATGQDPAQVVESSMCMTLMEAIPNATTGVDDLLVTVSMPSIEVGTVGGGTILSPQRALLEMLGVAGASKEIPGANAQRLARIIAAAVMAGELSLMGALSAGHLIQAHMKHNRSVPPTPGNVTPNGNGSGGLGSGSLSMSSGLGSMTPLVAPPIASSRASPTSSQMMTMTSRDSSSNASNSNDSTLSAKLSAKDRRSSSVC